MKTKQEKRMGIIEKDETKENIESVTRQEEEEALKKKKPEIYLQSLLCKHYDFRYNLLTEQVEYRSKRIQNGFELLDKRHLNSLCLELLEKGVRCWDKDVQRFIYSARIPTFHPFHSYMSTLPQWDGRDRVEPLIHRITNEPICIKGFYYWLIAMVSQWMGKDNQTGNSIVPILISLEQGLGKSTFCRNLVPYPLRAYYTDMVELNAKGKIGQRLVQNGLINLDELDRIPANKMPFLKNIIQVKDVSINKAYRSYFSNLPRIASFIGTSNRPDLLTDPSGSRRFICIEIKKGIDNNFINYEQLYAELKWFVEAGERNWLTHEEESLLQEHNKPFYRTTPGLELFNEFFSKGTKDDGMWLTINEIILRISTKRSGARDINPYVLSRELSRMGIRKEHRFTGNYYFVNRNIDV